jgi:serine/threonine protein kinase
MRVKHKDTGAIFALKKIPKDMIRSHFMIDQLVLEIKIQTYLHHKNILGVHGIFDDRTHLYLILDYMEQGTLYSQLKKQKILPER